MNAAKIFHSTWALQQLPATLKLFNLEWRFLLCADGKTSVEEIQKRLNLTDEQRETTLARLCASGLLTETAVSLEDFARSTVKQGSTQTEPQTFSEYLAAAEPSAAAPEENRLPGFSPLQKPTLPVTPARTMSLQSVIQFILNQNPDPTAGHLATYQVFMGVDTQLLKRNGITSLRFQDDRLITDPELQTAIADNIKKILKVSCPEDVFAAPVTTKKS